MSSIRNKIFHLKNNLNLPRILNLVKAAAPGWLYISLTLIVLETLAFFASLYLMKLLIDMVVKTQLEAGAAHTNIIGYVIFSGIAGVVYFILRSFSTYSVEVLSTRVSEFINKNVHEKAVNLQLSFYESPAYYDILKRAMEAGTDKPGLIIATLIEILKNCLSLAAVVSVLILINWLLLPIIALFIIPTLFIRLKYSKKLNELRIAQTPLERKSAYFSSLITTDTAAKEIRTYSLGAHLKTKFSEIRNILVKEKLSLSLKKTQLEVATTALSYVGIFFCIGFIALRAISGESSTGDISLFLFAFPQAFGLLQNISGGISNIYQNSIYINSSFELLQLENDMEKDVDTESMPLENDICIKLKDVKFSYPYSDKQTISGINLTIPSGKIIGLVGLNGAGKSTLIKLLCRLYDPTEGEILYGNKNIKQLNSLEYRKQLGVVFQDFNRYSFSAGENIFFGNIHQPYNTQRVKEAAEKSGIASFIESFPDGYETTMGRIFEDSKEVSIGQWQKIALARCFYSDARFLIFDEASSALDAVSEKELFGSFRERIGNRGAVIISHRRSAILHADYIYVLADGKVVEEGTDEELMQRKGAYASIFNENAVAEKEKATTK